jgi:hypothetical protein
MYEIKRENGIDYENALFVIKSMSDDESRPFMCVVHVEDAEQGSRLICTDGRRLHYADISSKIPEGDYKPVTTKHEIILKGPIDEGTFPNWKRVVPENGLDRGLFNLERTSIGRNVSLNAGFSLAYAQLIERTGEVVNLRYLDDLPKKEWQIYSLEKKNRPLVFKRSVDGKETVAVIMPMSTAA